MNPKGRDRSPVVVVALGGNALQSPGGDDDTVEADLEHTADTASHLVAFALAGKRRLVVTHGNGPQVGNHLLRSEAAHDTVNTPLLPLDVCVADTQGGMGYMLQQGLANSFHEAEVAALVSTVVTQVVVDADDPEFDNPSKPVGELIDSANVATFSARGWVLVEDRHRGGYRRVVPSPDPKEIVEAGAIRAMVEDGVVVIAAGGGGVPVISSNGRLEGVPAVVDKDLASALLATDLRADALVILTDVESVYTGYGTDDQRAVHELRVSEARRLLDGGEFPRGSMGPKVEAVARYVQATGGVGVITSIERAEDALAGKTGTRIVS